MQYRYISKSILTITWAAILFSSCEKMVEVGPPKTEISSETVFTSDASAIAAVRGIYSLMMTNQSFANGQIELYTGLSSDELDNYSTSDEQLQFYSPSLVSTNSILYGPFWREAYTYIFNANSLLDGLNKSTGLSTSTKSQLEGEAKFLRAFCHFYLVNLFGDVPYVTTTDYKINAIATRTTASHCYQLIIQDLLEAQSLMSDGFSNDERIEPNKGAATAMLARVYLYTGEWEKAEAQASLLINNTALYTLETDLGKVFLANSSEAIWQLQPVVPGINTTQGEFFILTDAPENTLGGVALTNEFCNSFETGDTRRDNWIGTYSDGTTSYYYPFKYKIAYSDDVTEYNMILRLAEQYLIRAEARAQLNNVSGAQDDINAIRHRAGLGDTPAGDKNLLLAAISQERKVEFFAEWGHRWLDLKRSGHADIELMPVKNDWQSTDTLYPIPHNEIIADPNLKQNPGY